MSLVFIVADSLRHDALWQKGESPRTPFAEELAKQSVVFERVVSSAPWTVPSVAAMLTGVYAHRLGLAKWEQPWPPYHPNLFQLAKAAGFKVASFVFDESHLFRNVPSAMVSGSSQDTSSVLEALRKLRNEKYVVFLHYWWTHVPYVARPMSIKTWRLVTDEVLNAMRSGPKAQKGVKRLYRETVRQFSEEWLPRVLEAIDLETTTLVITADHGESWGERAETKELKDVFDLHGNTLYEEVIRVPLLVRPAGGDSGKRIRGLARTVDILPTIVELLELGPLPKDIDGVSLKNAVQKGISLANREAISVMNRDFVDCPRLPQKPEDLWIKLSLSQERYKVIWEPASDKRQVFDLSNDPGEKEDIGTRYIPELSSADHRLRQELTRACVGEMPSEIDEPLGERFRNLGYL